VSAIPLILLSAAAGAAAAGGAALCTARGLHRRLDALEARLDAPTGPFAGPEPQLSGAVPQARAESPRTEIRAAVAEALAEERERELAEARAFWAAHEAEDGDPAGGSLLAGRGRAYEITESEPNGSDPAADEAAFEALLAESEAEADADPELSDAGPELPYGAGEPELPRHGGGLVPRQQARDLDDLWALDDLGAGAYDGTSAAPPVNEAGPAAGADAGGAGADGTEPRAEPGAEPPELAAARLRHPSQPDFTLAGEPVPGQPSGGSTGVADQQRTVGRLSELALARTPLSDIRQGPLGTLDVYVFEDGTTLCLSPGHRETAERLCSALRDGDAPVLMGGSTVSGAYALSFGYGEGRTAYLLADRVIASM